ncbi:MAG: PorV/PorQ family protein [candidate division Zixibacteria bacterium]|nr:PorV/PorQ family protein [candidate division Zixibacteria bacterium]
MKSKIVFLMLILLVVSLNPAYAGNDRRIGTAGAQELRIPIGSRGTALGGAILADVKGIESVYWNPAGLANMEGTEAMFSHQPYLAEINVNFAGVATTIEGFGTIGAAAKIISIGDMEETTEEYPDGSGRTFGPSLSVISMSYARILTNRVTFGITGKFIYEKIFEVSASGIAFDAGVIYDPGWHGVKMGMVLKDYGPQMKFSGMGFNQSLDNRPVRPIAASFDLPSSLNIGMSYTATMGANQTMISGNFVNNNYSMDMWQGGVEYVYDGKYALRGGYNYSSQDNWQYGLTLGGGLTYDFQGTKISFEYTWADVDTFDANQYFTLKLQF